MLLDTLHEDAIPADHCHTSKLPNSNCRHEGEVMEEGEMTNQIPVAGESHHPPQCENSDPSAQSHDQRKPSVVTETFQGMLRNEVWSCLLENDIIMMSPTIPCRWSATLATIYPLR